MLKVVLLLPFSGAEGVNKRSTRGYEPELGRPVCTPTRKASNSVLYLVMDRCIRLATDDKDGFHCGCEQLA